jgi:DNA polymerase epsilon subunit 1
VLIFKDIYNFAGIPASPDSTLKISSNFQMLDLLPEDLKNICLVVIAQVLKGIHSILVEAPDSDRQIIIGWLKETISKEMSQQLFDILESLKRSEGLEFPVKVGAQFLSQYPPLEFIKIVTHILALEADILPEVLTLQKNLFKLVGFSNFSGESVFVEPCAALVIPEIICKKCVYTRDIDFCKDPMISNGIWKCSLCNGELDRREFERKLVVLMKNRIREFQMQDLKCGKCKMNRGGFLNRLCPCSGKFHPTRSKEEFSRFIGLVLEVASFHGFRYLEEIIAPILTKLF